MFNGKLATPQVEFFNLGVCRSLPPLQLSSLYTGWKIRQLETMKQKKGLKFEINLMFNAKLATPQIEFFNLGICRSLFLSPAATIILMCRGEGMGIGNH